MTLKVPCGRAFEFPDGQPGWAYNWCDEGNLCSHCSAIRILRSTCSGVADRLEGVSLYPKGVIYDAVNESIGRLRADVARVEGRT